MEYDKDILEQTGIFVFRGAISKELCKKTIDTFYKNPKQQFNGKTGSGYKPHVKNTTDWYVTEEYELNKKLSNILSIATSILLAHYYPLKKVPFRYGGLQFQKSEINKGKFVWHWDNDEHNLDEFRLLAPIFYLNTVEEGGETEFKFQNFNLKPEEGTLVIFPCTWQYWHRGVKPLSSNKYIITTFALGRRR